MLVKSVRNALIGFVVLGFALYWASKGEADRIAPGFGAKAKFVWEKFPKFVLGFLVVAVIGLVVVAVVSLEPVQVTSRVLHWGVGGS